jgi:hypothetical protein
MRIHIHQCPDIPFCYFGTIVLKEYFSEIDFKDRYSSLFSDLVIFQPREVLTTADSIFAP